MPAKKATTKKATQPAAKKAAKKAAKPSAPATPEAAAKKAVKAATKKAVEKLATKKVAGAPATPSAPTAPGKSVPTKLKATRKTSNPPSLQTVQEMAYLNYLHRSRHGLPGDSMSDWIAAIDSLAQSDRAATEQTMPLSDEPKKPSPRAKK
jgi:hypothetical protein